MSENKERVGAAWEFSFENSSKPKFNALIDPKKLAGLPINDQGEIKLKLVKQEGDSSEKSPSHFIVVNNYKPGEPKERDVSESLYVNINKEKLSSLPVGENSSVYLEISSKKHESIGQDRSDYFVRDNSREGNKEFVGRAWSPSQIVENKNYVGSAFKKDFEDGGKAYNVSLKKDDVEKLKADDYGNIRISIAKKKDAGDGPTHSVYQSVGKEPYSEVSLSLNKEKISALPVNDRGYVSISVVDKKTISKDKADLTVYENAGKSDLPKNFVGSGWSNQPGLIRLQKEDVTPDGLSKAISNNHATKVHAILNSNPDVVQKKHVALVKEMQEKSEKFDKGLSTMVSVAYDEKQGKKSGIKI